MIIEYILETPWDVSTAGSSVDSLALDIEESDPKALFFKNDGTEFYILGNEKKRIIQYDMTDSWCISSASYSSEYFSISSQENNPTGLYIRPDGDSFYIVGDKARIFQYSLSTPWTLSATSYSSKSFSVSSEELNPQGLYFKDDGRRVYIIGYNETIYEYELTIPWDISTAFYNQKNLFLKNLDIDSNDLFFKNNGESVYIIEDKNDKVFQLDTNEYWELSSYSNIPFNGTINGGNLKTTYFDLKNKTNKLQGHYIFCETEVVFDLSEFDQTRSKIIKAIFDSDNGEKTKTFSAYVSNNQIYYPDLSNIKAIYYPSEVFYTYYNPKFTIIYEDGMNINLTIPITSVQCGIFEAYKNKTIVDTSPFYKNPDNLIVFINDKNDNTISIGNINTKLPFTLEEITQQQSNIVTSIQLAQFQSTIAQIAEPTFNENPTVPPAPKYNYSSGSGIVVIPNNSVFYQGNTFAFDTSLNILSGGAPYFAGTGISIKSSRR
jgi:hypothetical protein